MSFVTNVQCARTKCNNSAREEQQEEEKKANILRTMGESLLHVGTWVGSVNIGV